MTIEATKFYIRHRGAYPETEMQDASRRGMEALNVETAPYYWAGDDDCAGDFDTITDLSPTVGISGYLGDVWRGLKKLGRPIPPALDYPEPLTGFLGRRIWQSVLGEVRATVSPLFVKPVEHKKFSGLVWWPDNPISRLSIPSHGDDTPVWISEPVKFVSEWRSCVLYRKLVGCQHYKGDWFKSPNRDVVEAAVKAMGRRAPHAYCLDWGVTDDGRTLLVEANDGYAFGNYGLNNVTYARMLSARWYEMAGGGEKE